MSIYWTWDPWRELGQLREEVEGVLGRYGRSLGLVRGTPPVNIHQSDDGFTVTAEVPGIKGEDLSVEAEGEVLRISGRRERAEGVEKSAYHRRERRSDEFVREIRLPAGLDTDKIEAKLADGILTVHMPKAEAAKPRKITVKAS